MTSRLMRARLRRLRLRLRVALRHRWKQFDSLWRRSLQLRVVVSTLALSSAVVFVLGMVLQTQISERLLEAKESAAIVQAETTLPILERELTAVDPNSENVAPQLEAALNRLTTSQSGQSTESVAGAYDPVLVDGQATSQQRGLPPSAGRVSDVPEGLRRFVERGRMVTQITTVPRGNDKVTMLVVGTPVGTATRPLQVYLLFPLTAEQHTLAVVQSTLLVSGVVLLGLLGAITSLVTRQVVRPVRQAASTAERLANGNLDERMRVIGEDDVARLAESFNEMADSLKQQIRQLEEFGELQRRFTSDVSHELRTPLTTVRMAADVLHASKEQFPEGLSRSTELMVDELDRFESLLTDLLEISRLDDGEAELAEESLNATTVVAGVLDSLRAIAESSGVTIRPDLPTESVTLVADARRVERIVRNLVANAIDHAEGGPIDITLAGNDTAVALTVRDYGVGLQPGEEELVFTRFWRADPSRNRRTGGTGLGLSISSEDAKLHGGRLDAWGRPGEGACFRLTLPRHPRSDPGESPLELPVSESARENSVLENIAAPGAILAARPEDLAVRRDDSERPTVEEYVRTGESLSQRLSERVSTSEQRSAGSTVPTASGSDQAGSDGSSDPRRRGETEGGSS